MSLRRIKPDQLKPGMLVYGTNFGDWSNTDRVRKYGWVYQGGPWVKHKAFVERSKHSDPSSPVYSATSSLNPAWVEVEDFEPEVNEFGEVCL